MKRAMKYLQRIILIMLAFVLAFSAAGQSIGLKAGFSLSNMVWEEGEFDITDELDYLPGFQAGVFADFPIVGVLSIETGALLTTKGYSFKEGDDFEFTLRMYYVDVPVAAKASFPVGNVEVYGLLGPQVSFGLTGKAKTEVGLNGETEVEEEDIEWSNDPDEGTLQRFDYGIIAGAGVEFSNIQAGVSYYYGLANAFPGSDKDYQDVYKYNHRVFAVTVGYYFNRP